MGTLQGQYVMDTLDLDNAAGPFHMEITAGDPADNNATYFYQGAIDVLQPYIDSGKLVVVSGQTDFDTVATARWGFPDRYGARTECVGFLLRRRHPD